MYDLRSVGTYAGSIDKMESSVYTIVVHNGKAEVFGDISSAVIKYKDDNLVFLTYAEWEDLLKEIRLSEIPEVRKHPVVECMTW